MLNRLIFSVVLLAGAVGAAAGPIVVDTSLWTKTVTPAHGYLSSSDDWTRLHANTPTRSSNSSGALISDFSLQGDFLFSGTMTPKFGGQGCTSYCDDNDIMGLVFGWQDEDNHYRLGWSQGGLADITGKKGLFLVREVDGSSSTIWKDQSLFWLEDNDYSFSIQRLGEELLISLSGLGTDVVGTEAADGSLPSSVPVGTPFDLSFSILDTVFEAGRIGVYSESQIVTFSNLSVSVPVVPSAALLLAGALALVGSRKRRPQ